MSHCRIRRTGEGVDFREFLGRFFQTESFLSDSAIMSLPKRADNPLAEDQETTMPIPPPSAPDPKSVPTPLTGATDPAPAGAATLFKFVQLLGRAEARALTKQMRENVANS